MKLLEYDISEEEYHTENVGREEMPLTPQNTDIPLPQRLEQENITGCEPPSECIPVNHFSWNKNKRRAFEGGCDKYVARGALGEFSEFINCSLPQPQQSAVCEVDVLHRVTILDECLRYLISEGISSREPRHRGNRVGGAQPEAKRTRMERMAEEEREAEVLSKAEEQEALSAENGKESKRRLAGHSLYPILHAPRLQSRARAISNDANGSVTVDAITLILDALQSFVITILEDAASIQNLMNGIGKEAGISREAIWAALEYNGFKLIRHCNNPALLDG